MPTPAEILVERIDERLAAISQGDKPKTRYWLSMQLAGRGNVVTDIVRKGFMPSEDRLHAMAELLETTIDYLKGRSASPAQPVSEVGFRGLESDFQRGGGKPIPVVGSAYCDDLLVDADGGEAHVERIQIDIDHVARLIERPRALFGANDAYAIYMHGSSMEPRFFQGETAIVDPRRPPAPGDYVLVQLNDGLSDEVMTILVKRLVRISSADVELEQHNPPMTFRLPRKKVARMHRIYRPDELIG